MRVLFNWISLLALLSGAQIAYAAAPPAPQNLRVTINSPFSALLEWDESSYSDTAVRYLVTRNKSSKGSFKVPTFLDNGLLPERTFDYTVITINTLGERSAASKISVTTPAKPSAPVAVKPETLAAPTGARLDRYSKNSLELFWNRVNNAYLRYDVLRNNKLLSNTDGTSFFDILIDTDAPYQYQIIAIDKQGRRSAPAKLSVNAPTVSAPNPPKANTIANPDNPTLSIYSSTAAELFWTRPAAQVIGATQVEVFRDGRKLGTTNGTSYYDDTRTNRNHQYKLTTVRDGQRSAGVSVPEVATPPVVVGNAAFIDAIKPQVTTLSDKGDGLDIFLLNGQSNANPQFLNAMTEHLSARGFNYITGHFYVGGQPISTWISEDGVTKPRWSLMMSVFDGTTALCESDPDAIRSITLVYYQGEADVNTTDTVIAAQKKTPTPFKQRLSAFTTEFTRHFEERCGITPNIALAIISFNETHPLFPARLSPAHALIRKDISDIAREQRNVGAFDTFDLEHADHVHLALYPTSQAQFTAAGRAIDLFFK